MYHISQNGRTEGPYELSELRRRLNAGTLRAHDLVWQEGMTDWVRVSSVPGLVDAGNAYAAPRAPSMDYGPPPPSHLVWAILATCLCCLPFGIVAIVYASQVESNFYAGRHLEAVRASKNAKTWTIVSVVSIFVPFLFFALSALLGAIF